jgi:NAD(P)-dependent dehydrogenase (short-subunit alcohol dehydrogenase family)
MSAYVTSKWGLRGLTRTLHQEVKDLPGVHVCSISPGSVDTPIYTSAANYAGFVGRPPPPVDQPAVMAKAIIRNADHPRLDRSVGSANRFVEFGFTWLPWVYDTAVGPLARRMALSRPLTSPVDGNVFGSRPRVEGGPVRWGRARVGALVGATAGLAALAAAGLVHKQRR